LTFFCACECVIIYTRMKTKFILFTALTLSLVACGKTHDPVIETIKVTGVSLEKETLELSVGSSETLNYTITPENATNKAVTWSIDNTNYADIDTTGKVTAKAAGIANVTVKTVDGEFTDSLVLTVKKQNTPVETIAFDKKDINLALYNDVYLSYTILPYTASDREVSFSSSNKQVAIVDEEGKVSGLTEGDTTITVTTHDGGHQDTCNIHVQRVNVASVSFNKKDITLGVGKDVKLSYTISPYNATNKNVSFKSNDTNVVEVDDSGKVTAKAAGQTTVEIKTEDQAKTDVANITVSAKEIYDVRDYYNGYYSGIESWTNGEDLKNQLYTRIRNGYTALSYGDPNWESNQYAEQDLYNFDEVDVVYSGLNYLKTDTNKSGSGWQREHIFCASLMTGYTSGTAVSALGRATDFHNLYASDSAGNTSRGNKHYGNAMPNKPGYQDKTILNGKDGYSCDSSIFEPGDMDKGRAARSIFYMGVMYSKAETASLKIQHYKEETGTSTKTDTVSVTYKPLTIKEEVVDFDKEINVNNYLWPSRATSDDLKAKIVEAHNTYGTGLEGFVKYSDAITDYSIGNLSSLLEWAGAYDVDVKEMQHNESVYSHIYSKSSTAQGNRNPFVDYPELAEYVYGDKKNQAGRLEELKPAAVSLDAISSETRHYAIADAKTEYEVGQTLTKADYKIKDYKKNFTITDATFTNTNPDYTFVEADIGEKEISLTTPLNTLKYKVKVVSASTDPLKDCNFNVNTLKTNFKDSKVTTSEESMLNMNGTSWTVVSEVATGASKASGVDAVKIGGSTATTPAAKTLTFKAPSFTYDSKNKIAGVFIKGNPASKMVYNINITVGSFSKNLSITYQSGDYPVVGTYLDTPVSGDIVITISNISAAFNIMNIAVKTVD